jgi:hypothetical protein
MNWVVDSGHDSRGRGYGSVVGCCGCDDTIWGSMKDGGFS